MLSSAVPVLTLQSSTTQSCWIPHGSSLLFHIFLFSLYDITGEECSEHIISGRKLTFLFEQWLPHSWEKKPPQQQCRNPRTPQRRLPGSPSPAVRRAWFLIPEGRQGNLPHFKPTPWAELKSSWTNKTLKRKYHWNIHFLFNYYITLQAKDSFFLLPRNGEWLNKHLLSLWHEHCIQMNTGSMLGHSSLAALKPTCEYHPGPTARRAVGLTEGKLCMQLQGAVLLAATTTKMRDFYADMNNLCWTCSCFSHRVRRQDKAYTSAENHS